MVQPQVVDYVKSQLLAGVPPGAIKNALIVAGWAEVDIDDSVKSASAMSRNAGASFKSQNSISLGDIVSSSLKDISTSVVSDQATYKKKAGIPEKISTSEHQEKTFQKISGLFRKFKFHKLTLALAIFIAVAVLCAGAAVFFYLENIDLQNKIFDLTHSGDLISTKFITLSSQASDLMKAKNDLEAEVRSLTSAKSTLVSELSFFIAPQPGNSAADLAVTINGVVGIASGGQYVLTTSDGVKIYVKNYEDAKVDTVLKSFVGKSVEISGTHAGGSRSVKVTAVNGAPI